MTSTLAEEQSSNGGTGGQGGYGWDSLTVTNSTDGGFGGAPFQASTSALVMGGAGGAGTTRRQETRMMTFHAVNGAGNGIFSSGGAGGGVAIMHAGSVVGSGNITSNGQSTPSTLNDSTGGAGAGGSILIFANSGGLGGRPHGHYPAIGGNGGNAWPTQAPGGFPGERHGPGGGGGGGVIFLSASPAVANVAGGSNGYTNTVVGFLRRHARPGRASGDDPRHHGRLRARKPARTAQERTYRSGIPARPRLLRRAERSPTRRE